MQAKNQFSRRQLRIKIFQLLYSLQDVQTISDKDFRKLFLANINKTESSFTALTLFIVRLFDYTLIYANKKASKFIRTEADNVDISLTEIEFLELLKSNNSFTTAVKHNTLQHLFPDELLKKTFSKLIETPEYAAFHNDKLNATAIENLIFRAAEYAIDKDEQACEFFEEKFIHWEDDIEIIQRWLQLLVKQPDKIIFYDTLTTEKIEFSVALLSTYSKKFDYLNELIAPKLKNWDADRVAAIDLILLRLGLGEMLFFPEIPVKVTINEYIDIAKMYSTPQSGQFVNGVLDNLRKSLETQGELRKHS